MRRFNLLLELKACSISRDLVRGRIVHKAAIKCGDDCDAHIANTLIDMYGKCCSMPDAQNVFDSMSARTIVSWTALVLGYAGNGEGELALDLFSRLDREGFPPNARSFVAALKACTEIALKDDGVGARERGAALHLLATRCCPLNVYVGSTLIDMYAKCGSMENARKTFDSIEGHDVVSWTAMVMGYADNGESEKALSLFVRMQDEGCSPNPRTFVAALKACGDLEVKQQGITELARSGKRLRALHLLASRCNCDSDIYVENSLVDMYATLGNTRDARSVFDRMRYPDVISYNVLILGYAENGEGEMALELFSVMARKGCAPNNRTFVSAIKACIDVATVTESRDPNERSHSLASSGVQLYSENTLLEMYARSGSLDDARVVFNRMQRQDVVSWKAFVLGYVENGEGEVALDMFSRIAPNAAVFSSALKACSDLTASDHFSKLSPKRRGRAIHFFASVSGCCSDIYVENTLVDMYARFGSMKDARRVFDNMQHRNVVTWTALILGYAENGDCDLALSLFGSMGQEGCVPNARTYVAALKACNLLAIREPGNIKLKTLKKGRKVHLLAATSGCSSNIYVENTFMDMYAKCGSMDDALRVFEAMECRSVISWNIMLSGYADNGEGAPVLELFARMKREACRPDAISFVAVLRACGMLGALEHGKAAHAEIWNCGFQDDRVLVNCLVDVYTKCGSLNEAKQVFDLHSSGDVVTWHALMAGYSRHGDTDSVFGLFERLKLTSLRPNRITFLCVLTACSRAGDVARGNEYFQEMISRYAIDPDAEHYGCMVDILGRANKLDEAMALLRSMPLSPNAVIWMTVLAACRKWKNVELGRLAFDSVTSLDDSNPGGYCLMANT